MLPQNSLGDPTERLSEPPYEKFSDETIAALIELGNALLAVYNRLAVEKGEPVSGNFVLKPRKQHPDEERLAA